MSQHSTGLKRFVNNDNCNIIVGGNSHLKFQNCMAPSTTKQWKVVRTDKGFDGLEFEDASIPRLGENDVLVRFHAVSLNFRDLMIPRVG